MSLASLSIFFLKVALKSNAVEMQENSNFQVLRNSKLFRLHKLPRIVLGKIYYSRLVTGARLKSTTICNPDQSYSACQV